jgi:hypothetical protein
MANPGHPTLYNDVRRREYALCRRLSGSAPLGEKSTGCGKGGKGGNPSLSAAAEFSADWQITSGNCGNGGKAKLGMENGDQAAMRHHR